MPCPSRSRFCCVVLSRTRAPQGPLHAVGSLCKAPPNMRFYLWLGLGMVTSSRSLPQASPAWLPRCHARSVQPREDPAGHFGCLSPHLACGLGAWQMGLPWRCPHRLGLHSRLWGWHRGCGWENLAVFLAICFGGPGGHTCASLCVFRSLITIHTTSILEGCHIHIW